MLCTKQKDNCIVLANHVNDTCPLKPLVHYDEYTMIRLYVEIYLDISVRIFQIFKNYENSLIKATFCKNV